MSAPHGTSPNGHRPDEGDDIHPPAGWSWSGWRYLAALVVIAMVAFWSWAFIFDPSVDHPDDLTSDLAADHPDHIAAVEYTTAAEAICAAALDDISALPVASAARDFAERADQIDLGTDRFDQMLDELDALPLPGTEQGDLVMTGWLSDYRVFMEDRRDYADELRSGVDPPFLISGNEEGVRITDLIDTVADVNDMESCRPGADV